MKTPIYCLLFPGYQTLDLMEPVEILHRMSNSHLHYVSREGGGKRAGLRRGNRVAGAPVARKRAARAGRHGDTHISR